MEAVAIKSTGELEKMSSSELVTLFNSLNPPKPVTRFADKETAVRRCLGLMAAASGDKRAQPPASMPKKPDLDTKPAPKPNRTTVAEGTPRRVQFDYEPKEEIKAHREGTKRARVIELLSRAGGATFEEVMDDPRISWDRRTTYEGIKLLHTHVGYGLKEDETTHKIKLVKEVK